MRVQIFAQKLTGAANVLFAFIATAEPSECERTVFKVPAQKDVDKEAEEKSAPSAQVVYEAIRKEGRHELERTSSSLAWSGLAAGMSMGFSFVTMAVLEHCLPDAPWKPLITSFGYSVGFLIVILGRQQLFTENTLTVILPLLTQKTLRDVYKVLILWSVVLTTNLVGTFLFAWAVAKTDGFNPDLRGAFDQVAAQSMTHPFGVMIWQGVFAGWLIALMVWLLPAAETARIWIIVVITWMVAVFHFPHIIAGASETFYLAITAQRSFGEILNGFILPALIGNTIGGVTLVAALAHAQTIGDKKQHGHE
ncbi:MAG: formate/nitrite transporter family protein [Chthoniobacterales bacterium]